jgi:hypothetical protein
MEDAERRRASAETRAHPVVADEPSSALDRRRNADRADPPTRRLSLADELFGGDDDDDATIHLPRVNDGHEDR